MTAPTGPPGRPAELPPCTRCGRQAPPGSGAFCPWCGRYLAALEWVASPPPPETLPGAVRPAEPAAPAAAYTGPPRYRAVPRWGLPLGPWRTPAGAAGGGLGNVDRARAMAGQLIPVLWVTAGMSALAAVAEAWRYALLLASRSDALSPVAVGWSDALVWFAGWSSVVAAVAAGGLTVAWSLAAHRAAAERAGIRPWRTRRRIVLGWLVPGWNLTAPGSMLAETEHAALELPPGDRPSPSRELRVWWALWAACVVLAAVTLVWRFRSGTQALADGVVLHAWADLLVAVTAYRTIRMVRWITGLLEPGPRGPRELLVRTSRSSAAPAASPPAEPDGAAVRAG
ncbi:DUF4328 domain-containing protein [Pseudonocardia nematodicida]|uniref:DUF4328 domain-containing protein n=1 Tax=Pseudonocardia nematodicida TaxID=1206997 RepID=A0ABV1K9W9_9PSEU